MPHTDDSCHQHNGRHGDAVNFQDKTGYLYIYLNRTYTFIKKIRITKPILYKITIFIQNNSREEKYC